MDRTIPTRFSHAVLAKVTLSLDRAFSIYHGRRQTDDEPSDAYETDIDLANNTFLLSEIKFFHFPSPRTAYYNDIE